MVSAPVARTPLSASQRAASSVGPGAPVSWPRKASPLSKLRDQPELTRATSPGRTSTPASSAAALRSSSVIPYPPGRVSSPCRPATSRSTPRQTTGSIASMPCCLNRPPRWASSVGMPPWSSPSWETWARASTWVPVWPPVTNISLRPSSRLRAPCPRDGASATCEREDGWASGASRSRVVAPGRRPQPRPPRLPATCSRYSFSFAAGKREGEARRAHHGLVYEPAVLQGEGAGAGAGGLLQPGEKVLRLGDLLLRWRKDLVYYLDLRRVDRRAPHEAHVLSLHRGAAQTLRVAHVRVHALHRAWESRGPRGGHQPRAGVEEPRVAADAQIRRQIRFPEAYAHYLLVGPCDLEGELEPQGRLDKALEAGLAPEIF